MLKRKLVARAGTVLISTLLAVCSCTGGGEQTLKSFPLDDTADIISTLGVTLDEEITHDGGGSVRIATTDTTIVALYEVFDVDLEDALLNYRAQLKTENVTGKVYLRMHVLLPDKGEYIAGALVSALTGTNDWTEQKTGFILKAGENPDRVTLNVVVEGAGTVWIDEIELFSEPLP